MSIKTPQVILLVVLSILFSLLSTLFFYENIENVIVYEEKGNSIDFSSNKIKEIHKKGALSRSDLELINKEFSLMKNERLKNHHNLEDVGFMVFYNASQKKYFWVFSMWFVFYFVYKGKWIEPALVVFIAVAFSMFDLFSLTSLLIISIVALLSFLFKKCKLFYFSK